VSAALPLPAARARVRPLPFVALSALVALYFFQLGARDLVSSHEARAAQNAQRMLSTGEWGLPTLFDGQPDLQKPPLYYWLSAACGAPFGTVAPFAARLPAALSAVACVLLVFAFVRREAGPRAALVAAVVLATANHFVAIGRTARIDVPLALAVCASLLAFYRGSCATSRKRERRLGDAEGETGARASGSSVWFALSAVAAGCAVLLKGPVALALVGPVAVAWLALERCAAPREARPRLTVAHAVMGIAVVAAVAVPWFAWVHAATDGEFTRVFFWYHNVSRFAGDADALAVHPWWYYGPRGALALMPWALLAPLVVWAFRSGFWRERPAFRFGCVWCAVTVGVLSAAQFKRADYLLPAFPGAALALGCAACGWLHARPQYEWRAKGAFAVLTAGALAVWPVMWFAVEPKEAARHEKRPFAAAIRSRAPAPQPVILFRTESHLLAYHLGPPLTTLVEWGDLRAALSAPGAHAVVMPPEYVADAERYTNRKFVPVVNLADTTGARPHRPLVCLRPAD
jgi:4-amino-4-deoxy-L-arabinose transferase-like glycosyltransferase